MVGERGEIRSLTGSGSPTAQSGVSLSHSVTTHKPPSGSVPLAAY